jgi:2-C-methyl-D-erythritol 4-phosphate cytidylyltransferase
MTRAAVLIVAAGEGRRFGGAKQFAPLGGRPVLAWSVEAFARHPRVDAMILVLPPGRDGAPFLALDPKVRAAVEGGPRRQDSVRNGFDRLAADGEGLVLVHDGVRPFVAPALIDRVLEAAAAYGAAVPAVEIEDTVKEVRDGRVVRTASREGLVRAQTPQGFRFGVLRDALDHARVTGFLGTDEASLVEHLGRTVVVVPGDPRNIKITRAEDLALAEAWRHD